MAATKDVKEWIIIPVVADDVTLMGRCICGRCSKNRDAECTCGLKYSSMLHICPSCGRPLWCKS
jgi:hypothetical protein